MWRRTYLLLLLVRLYCALSPSYLHPDENFQGPEVIAGRIFSYPVHKTWEFNSEKPLRSAFTLWPVYGLPMLILRWLWEGSGHGLVPPSVVYWTLRVIMFGFSFVLEDWAIYELIEVPRLRRIAVMLVASSYVTWSWQVHTFSNSIETLLVLWALVLVQRLKANNLQYSPLVTSGLLAFLLVYGTFNRITFPAFVIYPLFRLIPHIWRRPLTLIFMAFVAGIVTLVAIIIDTAFYSSPDIAFMEIVRHPIVTPLNSFLYNTESSNLALHGTHPFYLHFVVNLPQMLGPVIPLLFLGLARFELPLLSAICGVGILSFFSHQEARFLIPAIPLVLSSVHPPYRFPRAWLGSWITFNVLLGTLMSIYHQGGVVPAQIFLETQTDVAQAFWWKTYSPPIWLLNGRNENMTTTDLMGLDGGSLENRVCMSDAPRTVLVAPKSATYLDQFVGEAAANSTTGMQLQRRWSFSRHLNLDDVDLGEDGVVGTLQRVVGRRGLVVWDVQCRIRRANIMHGDW